MRQVVEYVEETIPADQFKTYEDYRRTVEQLRAAKDDASREKVSEKLTAELDTLFQRDIDRREKEVAEAETRVKKLREQLEKRKNAKKQIIDLHVQTLVNEANGLGFSFPFDTPFPAQQDFSSRAYGSGLRTYVPNLTVPAYDQPQPTPNRSSGDSKRPSPPPELEDPTSMELQIPTNSDDNPTFKPLESAEQPEVK